MYRPRSNTSHPAGLDGSRKLLRRHTFLLPRLAHIRSVHANKVRDSTLQPNAARSHTHSAACDHQVTDAFLRHDPETHGLRVYCLEVGSLAYISETKPLSD